MSIGGTGMNMHRHTRYESRAENELRIQHFQQTALNKEANDLLDEEYDDVSTLTIRFPLARLQKRTALSYTKSATLTEYWDLPVKERTRIWHRIENERKKQGVYEPWPTPTNLNKKNYVPLKKIQSANRNWELEEDECSKDDGKGGDNVDEDVDEDDGKGGGKGAGKGAGKGGGKGTSKGAGRGAGARGGRAKSTRVTRSKKTG
ncbi:hypothetical protein K458DRAFT_407550 [Lentithecium fluviatile CBS 122367]|uniref:Uncharacterized protein n=1 Tax=Lentithecium fluviatile CBS 122367 TaxID=1168545 RepID=A0A6G1IPP4_9PLEO|nr:hypothetical protein K458DRAFT_407550 [Lentithecium fluviatile CBS 122367]